jgi:hypothetical protein
VGHHATLLCLFLTQQLITGSGATGEMNQLDSEIMCSYRISVIGRNGGHLTALTCRKFTQFSSQYDAEEVKRCFAIENHTVSCLVKLIEEEGWTEEVDLIKGGRNELFPSQDEADRRRADWRKAINAGILEEGDVTWLTPQETNDVGTSFSIDPQMFIDTG